MIMMAGWTLGGSGAATIVSATTPFQTIEALAAAHALDDAPAMALCFFCGLAIHTTIFLGVCRLQRNLIDYVHNFSRAVYEKNMIMSFTSTTSARITNNDDKTTELVAARPTPAAPPCVRIP